MTVILSVRKKPVEVGAVRFTGRNQDEIREWCPAVFYTYRNLDAIGIETLEGDMIANAGDYIIKGVNGEFYPCKPDIFQKTYDVIGAVSL